MPGKTSQPGEMPEQGLYEVVDFNNMIAEVEREVRRTLHLHEMFDNNEAFAAFMSDRGDTGGYTEHVNNHLRTDSIGPVVSAACRLAFQATADGSPVKFFLKVGEERSARLARIDEADESILAVIFEVPADEWSTWVQAKYLLSTTSSQSLESQLDDFEGNALYIRAGAGPLTGPGVDPSAPGG